VVRCNKQFKVAAPTFKHSSRSAVAMSSRTPAIELEGDSMFSKVFSFSDDDFEIFSESDVRLIASKHEQMTNLHCFFKSYYLDDSEIFKDFNENFEMSPAVMCESMMVGPFLQFRAAQNSVQLHRDHNR
jgi:hypothetical protein